ncbi:TonB-dependent receptor plug domain-containing protein [Nonlabens sp. MIC269]|uniref:TonB-dependent receptor n=1 Tax=Nonlabens sp. MIC269 TaxID=1476901 RepID=UPI00345FCAFE
MKHFWVISMVLLCGIKSYSQQGTLQGYVFFDTNQPALAASIIVKNTNFKKEATAGVKGDFIIKNLPYGTYLLEITSLNAKPFTQTITIDQPLTSLYPILESTDLQELQEVLVKTETDKRRKETQGFSVTLINTEEAGTRNIQTNELLNNAVGVKLRQNGGLGSQVQYSLNGLSGSSVSIFIDGIPISMYGSSFNLNSIPPALIEDIEVYKGVVPGHLADDALGGVINVILKKGTKSNLNASVSYGSFNTFQSNVNGLYRLDKSGFTVKASGFYNYSDNDYKISGPTIVDIGLGGQETRITARRFHDAYRSVGGILQVGYTNVSWADQFFVGLTGSDDYKEVQHGAFVTKIPYKGRFLESDALLANLTYQKKDLLVKGLDVNVNGLIGQRNRVVNDTVAQAYSWTGDRAIDFQGNEFEYTWGSQQEGGPTLLHINRKVASIRSGLSYAFNQDNRILVNHVYSGLDRVDEDRWLSTLENSLAQSSNLYKNIYSLSYELDLFENRWKLNAFGKHYRQKVENIKPEFNDDRTQIVDEVFTSNKNYNGYGFATSYAISDDFMVLLSAERAIRLPSENEVFGDAGDNIIPNLTVQPEISENVNLGFRLGKYTYKKHEISLSTNLFSRRIKDLIGLPANAEELGENDELVQFDNFNEETNSRGFEAQVQYTYDNNLGINFNVSKLRLKTQNRRGQTVDIPNTPLFTMNTAVRYSIKNFLQKKARLDLFYNHYFTDEFSYQLAQGSNVSGLDAFLIPTQFVHDFGFSYAFPKQDIVLSFDIKNIFNADAFDNRSVQKPGRAFYLKLNYFINKF